jgi:hypothetical protein
MGVASVAKNGGPTTMLVHRTLSDGGIVVDASFVYWSDAASRIISKVPRSGGNPVDIATGLFTYRLAVDARYLYVASGDQSIQRIPLAGGAPEIVASDQGDISGLALDAQFVYWNSGKATIMKAPVSGGAALEFAKTGDHSTDLAIANSVLFWIEGQTLRSSGVSGESQRIVTSASSYDEIAADSGHAFLLSYTLTRVAISDASAELLLRPQYPGKAIILDEQNVYWMSDNRIFKLHK